MKVKLSKDAVFNVGLLVAIGYVIALPQSPIRRALQEWRQKAEQRRLVQQNWLALSGTSSRIDAGQGVVGLVEFADYQCPFCRDVATTVDTFVMKNPDVGVGFRHFPLERHAFAEGAARAAICAEEQGRFSSIHALLYDAVREDEEPYWGRLAERSGVPDIVAFRECMYDERTTMRLEEDRALAEALGVSGTPTFVGLKGIHVGTADMTMLDEMTR